MIKADWLTPQDLYYIVIALVTFLFVQHSRFYDPSFDFEKQALETYFLVCTDITLFFLFCLR